MHSLSFRKKIYRRGTFHTRHSVPFVTITNCRDDSGRNFVVLTIGIVIIITMRMIIMLQTSLGHKKSTLHLLTLHWIRRGRWDPKNDLRKAVTNTCGERKMRFFSTLLFPVNVKAHQVTQAGYTHLVFTPHKVLSLIPPQIPFPFVQAYGNRRDKRESHPC